MGIQLLPNPEKPAPTTALHIVGGRETTAKQFPVDLPFYASEPLQEDDHLGCVRGIAVAFGIQTVLAVLGFALWKLHFLIH